jgi:hypothetical protein
VERPQRCLERKDDIARAPDPWGISPSAVGASYSLSVWRPATLLMFTHSERSERASCESTGSFTKALSRVSKPKIQKGYRCPQATSLVPSNCRTFP